MTRREDAEDRIQTAINRDLARGDVRGLRGLELCARSVPLQDLMPAMKLDGGGPQFPPVTSGERKFEGFWPIESRKNAVG